MAHIKASAITTRIRELVADGYGSIRAIAATRFAGGMHEGLDAQHLSFLGSAAQKPADVAIVGIRPHPQRLAITGTVQIHLLDIEIRIVRTLDIEARINDVTRDAIRALSAEDADMLTQLLEWPPNLATTQAGTSTDLQGMTFVGSKIPVVGVEGAAMRIDTIHRFTGTALSRPATS